MDSASSLGPNVQSLSESGADVPETFIRSSEERATITPFDDFGENIPLIDLGKLENASTRAEILQQIADACENWGFFQIVNYGIPEDLVSEAYKLAREFFDLPQEEKELKARDFTKQTSNGYGRQFHLTGKNTDDWHDVYFHYLRPKNLKHVETWPHKPAAYSIFGEPMMIVRQNFYPACPQPDLVLGLRLHSDPNVMALLFQGEVAGLQVKNGGRWVSVSPVAGALVVNLGDQMQIVTNARFQSVEHRAVPNKGSARLSMTVFRHPSLDVVVCPAPELVDENHPAQYPAMNYGAYRTAFHSKATFGKEINTGVQRNLKKLNISDRQPATVTLVEAKQANLLLNKDPQLSLLANKTIRLFNRFDAVNYLSIRFND